MRCREVTETVPGERGRKQAGDRAGAIPVQGLSSLREARERGLAEKADRVPTEKPARAAERQVAEAVRNPDRS